VRALPGILLPALILAGALSACSGDDTTQPDVPVLSRIDVALASPSLPVGSKTRATAITKDQNGEAMSGAAVTWTATPASVAAVDATGEVTALGVGEAEVKATSGSVQGVARLTVTGVPVARVRITNSPATLQTQETVQLSAVAEDASGAPLDGRIVTWASNDTTKATVSSSGLVTAKRAGTVTISATSGGQIASSTLMVAWKPGLPFAVKGVKLWIASMPPEQNAEYTGGRLDRTRYESWRDVLTQIQGLGANDVMLQLSNGVMADPRDTMYSATLSYDAPDAVLLQLAEDARARGLTVSVQVFSHLQGVITGDNGQTLDRPSPTDRVAWLRNHRVRVLNRARLAQAMGARSMVVFADEVHHLVRDPALTAQWVQLIRDVRGVFSGQLTSIFWTGGDADQVGVPAAIVNELDYLGLGFFPDLSNADEPDVATLCRAYRKDLNNLDLIAELRALKTLYNKPIWITDKAFHSFRGAGYDEWRIFNNSIPLTPDQGVQARLFESFLSVMAEEGRGLVDGVWFQNYNNLADGQHDPARFLDGPLSESPQHKQAEGVIREWFSGARASSCPVS
jgi:hypothetical protein